MLFCTKQFVLFFAIVFALYWALPWRRARVFVLLAASLVFYAAWSKGLAAVVCCSTLMDYLLARGLDASSSPRLRRFLLGLSLAVNLGILGYFKYANFFLRSLEDALHVAGLSASLPVLRVVLPLGISFYTFEAISYTVDVYYRRIRAERSLPSFMLFILFFPHLVLGPVVRARDFLPQVARDKRWSWPRLALGARFLVLGIIKKLAVADVLAPFADAIHGDPGAYHTAALWLGAVAYALQVYCDFSGYSDIALGCAHLLGYKLARNFDMPFQAVNVSDFWRRWHISLSSWMRDYVFIPLGGSRAGRWRTYRNLVVTMVLSGLWHGAACTFLVFGLMQGLMLCVHRRFREACAGQPWADALLRSAPGTALRIGATFVAFCATAVVFRAPTLRLALTMLGGMVWPCPGLSPQLPMRGLWLAFLCVVLGHLLGQRAVWRGLSRRFAVPVQGMSCAALLTLALVLAPDASKAFVYFQF
jgi:alginate O-acetyltransferase complex protein AlgI